MVADTYCVSTPTAVLALYQDPENDFDPPIPINVCAEPLAAGRSAALLVATNLGPGIYALMTDQVINQTAFGTIAGPLPLNWSLVTSVAQPRIWESLEEERSFHFRLLDEHASAWRVKRAPDLSGLDSVPASDLEVLFTASPWLKMIVPDAASNDAEPRKLYRFDPP